MQDQAEPDPVQGNQSNAIDTVSSAIQTLSNKAESVAVDIENIFYSITDRLSGVMTTSNSILEQMSGLLADQQNERARREASIEEQSMIFNNTERDIGVEKSLNSLSNFIDEVRLDASKIQVLSQNSLLDAIKRMPMWVIGTLIGIGAISALDLGLPASNEEAGFTPEGTAPLDTPDSSVDGSTLADLIAGGESRGNYNIYNYKIREGKYGAKTTNLQEMTINQILREQSTGKMFAVGKYQMIPSTLQEGKNRLKLSGEEKFDAAMQERLFKEYLVGSKRPAIQRYITGQSDNIESALDALSLEFSSVSKTYGSLRTAGGKGDKASISRESAAQALRAEREMYNKRKQQLLSEQDTKPPTEQQKEIGKTIDSEVPKVGEAIIKETNDLKQSRMSQTKNVVNLINTNNKTPDRSNSNSRPDLIPAINLRA
jgi:muramidase (phage lysozyme)